jgi:hypothetical protein
VKNKILLPVIYPEKKNNNNNIPSAGFVEGGRG